MAISEVDMSGLSDAEREAMDGVDDAELNAMKGAGVQDLTGGDDDDDEPVAAAAPEAEAAVAVAPDPEAAADGDADEPDREFVPVFNAPAVEGLAEKLDELKTQEVELRAKLESGDIDIASYDEEKTRIIEARADLRATERLAEFAAQQNDANQKARWQWEQEKFFEQETSDLYKDPLLFATLDAAVKALANAPENSKRSAGWFLQQADKQVRERFSPAASAAATPKPAAVPASRDVPKTLAALPAAELPVTGGADEFAKLERLNGIELEKQLARMSPDEVDRYLRAA